MSCRFGCSSLSMIVDASSGDGLGLAPVAFCSPRRPCTCALCACSALLLIAAAGGQREHKEGAAGVASQRTRTALSAGTQACKAGAATGSL